MSKLTEPQKDYHKNLLIIQVLLKLFHVFTVNFNYEFILLGCG